ncbi:MAG: VOC family protein [Halioglobus sp.]
MTDTAHLLKNYILGPAHVGFVVEDMASAINHVSRLYGLSEEDVHYEPAPGIAAPTRFAFFSVGGLAFEYIEPCDEIFRAKLFAAPSGGGGINHIAWKVTDIHGALSALARHNVVPGYVTPDGVICIGHKLMVYLDPTTTGGQLVELIEEQPPEGE